MIKLKLMNKKVLKLKLTNDYILIKKKLLFFLHNYVIFFEIYFNLTLNSNNKKRKKNTVYA